MKLLNKLMVMAATAVVVASCGGGGGGGSLTTPPPVGDACSQTVQKQFVLDNMLFWYLWNNDLPRNVDLDDYATANDLLRFLTTFSPDDGSGQPVDKFSFLTTVSSDQAFFGEGQFEGFGFSYREVAANDLRFTRVFADGPAGDAGLERGQQIVALDGRSIADIQAAEGVRAVFDNQTVEFTLRPVGGNPDGSGDFVRTVTQGIVTIDPVPQDFIIPGSGGRNIGYIEFTNFISTAEPRFAEIFDQFEANQVQELIVDLRYNGGGLVRTAELFGDYIAPLDADGEIFFAYRFNADRAAQNDVSAFFDRLSDSLNLTQLVIIASRGTASASELVINGLDPHVQVTIVGDSTFGKPVGQIGLELQGCNVLLRPTAFRTVNSEGVGDFFGGLPVTPGCEAADDLNFPVGAPEDPRIQTARYYLENLACPPAVTPLSIGVASKPRAVFEAPRPDLTGPPHREFADAF